MDEILNITAKLSDAIKSDRVKRIALSTVLAQHKQRIFVNGQAADGGKIGAYSKKYAEKKTKAGRNAAFIDLVMTGQMQADYGLIISGDQYAFGFQNSFNADKMGWISDKKDKNIANLSEQEIELLMNILTEELNK